MKKIVIPASMLFVCLLALIVWIKWPAGAAKPSDSASSTASGSDSTAPEKKIAYWWDPMLGPSSISNHPGKSAMGMDLVPVFEDQTSSGPTVRIDPAVVQNMGVRTAAVVRGPLTVTVRAEGMLQVPEPGLHDVTLRINGYVQKLYADTEGMPVAKGQVLFDLYSPDLLVAEQELISAEQSLKALDSSAGQTARSDAQNLVDSAKQKLRLWDIAEQDIDAIAGATTAPNTVPFRSPANGHMVDKAIVEGSAVSAGMKVMRIEDHSNLWLDMQVYEDQIEMVQVGQDVQSSVDGIPGKTFDSKVTFIYPHLDHMFRTAKVRTVLANPNHELRPGMFATAEIVTHPLDDAILAPREAVIDTGTEQVVFIAEQDSPGHFEPRNVKIGIEGDNDLVQILDGLAPGDQVVTSGQFLMDVESRTNEAIDKLRNSSAATGNSN
jgi:membrane fusion protein, copper/silver efflux system